MLQAPIPATEKALARAGLRIDDIDLYEVLQTHPHGAPHRHARYEVRPTPYRVQVNEAFASVPLAWLKEMRADPTKLNVNGGACALGHPLGGTGAKLNNGPSIALTRARDQGLIEIVEWRIYNKTSAENPCLREKHGGKPMCVGSWGFAIARYKQGARCERRQANAD